MKRHLLVLFLKLNKASTNQKIYTAFPEITVWLKLYMWKCVCIHVLLQTYGIFALDIHVLSVF